jgi:hypothetical protein
MADEQKHYEVVGDEKDFFDGLGGGSPSFKFSGNGTGIKGTIVDQYRTFVTDTSGNVKTYPKSGEPIPQLNVTLQTALRDWKGVNPEKIPTDVEGNQLPGSEDDGQRRVYVKYDMRRAVAVAVKGVGERFMATGGTLAIKQTGVKDTGQPNGLPLYEARYEAPVQTDGGFLDGADPWASATPAPPAAAPAAPATPAPAAAPPAAPAPDDEPPF